MILLKAFLAPYLNGGIPFSWLYVYFFGKKDKEGKRLDLREHGSGNIGASNAMRFTNWVGYFICMILDGSKGLATVLVAKSVWKLPHTYVLIASAIAVLGHCFPICLYRKKGRGKGISTTGGILLGLGLYYEFLIFIVAMFLGLAITKIPAVGSLVGTICLVIALMIINKQPGVILTFFLVSALIWYRHKENIKDILAGKARLLETDDLFEKAEIK